jgi:hypothetical protein
MSTTGVASTSTLQSQIDALNGAVGTKTIDTEKTQKIVGVNKTCITMLKDYKVETLYVENIFAYKCNLEILKFYKLFKNGLEAADIMNGVEQFVSAPANTLAYYVGVNKFIDASNKFGTIAYKLNLQLQKVIEAYKAAAAAAAAAAAPPGPANDVAAAKTAAAPDAAATAATDAKTAASTAATAADTVATAVKTAATAAKTAVATAAAPAADPATVTAAATAATASATASATAKAAADNAVLMFSIKENEITDMYNKTVGNKFTNYNVAIFNTDVKAFTEKKILTPLLELKYIVAIFYALASSLNLAGAHLTPPATGLEYGGSGGGIFKKTKSNKKPNKNPKGKKTRKLRFANLFKK